MITVNQAQKENGVQINKISEKTMVFNKTELGCVNELWEEYLSEGLGSEYNFLVAQEGNKILGFICYGPHALTEGAYDIYWIAVDPDYQNRGIGAALVKIVEEEVRNLNGSLLIAETSSTPPYRPACEFYNRNGFSREATVRDFYAIGDHLLIYTKHLNQKASLHEDYLFQEA